LDFVNFGGFRGFRFLDPPIQGCVHKLTPDNRTGLSWITRLLTRFMNDWLLLTCAIFGQLIGYSHWH